MQRFAIALGVILVLGGMYAFLGGTPAELDAVLPRDDPPASSAEAPALRGAAPASSEPDPDETAALAPVRAVVGTIRSRGRAALADARVEVSLHTGARVVVLDPVVSATDGSYRVPLPLFLEQDPWSRRMTRLVVWAFKAGHAAADWGKDVAKLPDTGDWRADLELTNGITLRGRVVETDGRPSVGATVGAHLVGGQTISIGGGAGGAFRSSPAHSSATTDGLGRYVLTSMRKARTVEVWARSGGGHVIGASRALDGATEIELPDLQIAATWQIEGRVVFPGGAPVPGVTVEAFTPPGETRRMRFSLHEHRTHAVTDATGHFRVPVHQPGAVAIAPRVHVGEASVRTWPEGTRDARIELPFRVLRLTARSEEGRPLTGAEIDVSCLAADKERDFQKIEAGGLLADLAWMLADDDATGVASGVDAAWTVVVPHDQPVVCRTTLRDSLGGVLLSRPREDPGYEEAELVSFGRPSQVGSLRVSLTVDGVAVPKDAVGVLLRMPDGTYVVEGQVGPEGRIADVPVGRFLITLRPLGSRFAEAAPTHAKVEVRAGQTAEVSGAAVSYGRLELTFRHAEDPEATSAAELRVQVRPAWRRAADWETLRIWREGRKRHDASGSLPLGVELVAEARRVPGAYDLRVLWRGRVVLERGVRFTPGGLMRYEVDLGAKR